MTTKRGIVYVGLGSNVGNRPAYLRAAARGLAGLPKTQLLRLSPIYRTSPVGPRQRDFLNAVAKLSTELGPRTLFRGIKGLETVLGRHRRRRWGPREIDLDILYYGARRVRSRGLVIPHPRRAERKFVLRPLADVAPGFRDPVLGRTAARLLRQLTDPSQRIRLYRRNLSSRAR